jgi:hypothetical protein
MDLAPWIQVSISVFSAVLASSGLWAYLQKRFDRKYDARLKKDNDRSVEQAMLRGLAHDRITCLGQQYIDRGYITQDEYENLSVYLFEPYEKLGGNGSAARVMDEVRKLPLAKSRVKHQ